MGAGCVPEVSHAILLCVLQLLKSERWNFAVFEVALCVAVGELHAELMGLPGLRCCVPGLRGMAARELHAKLVRVARRVLLHAATLLRARGACSATVLLHAATPCLLRARITLPLARPTASPRAPPSWRGRVPRPLRG